MQERTLTTKLTLFFVSFSCMLVLSIVLKPGKAIAFQAGRIIDDSIFYSKDRMGQSAIQNFLNVKVPTCDTNGTEPYAGTTRAAYGTARGNPPPYTCLKERKFSVPSKPSDGLCNGRGASSNRTAAYVIYQTARSCGVNPQVLIVLLQKEQALVTDEWPWTGQFQKATGYGCPDTAPCNPQYAGFSNQVYEAARAYKRYRAKPNSYNYRAGRNNAILWHPNSACGTSTVFINNQATAGLYIYTPYRPNQAALNAGFGTGNSCSSYGNRNFWLYFKNWFGNPRATTPFVWTLYNKEAYSNPDRTQTFTSDITVRPNEKVYIRLLALNWGAYTWGNVFTRIGTSHPNDRTSQLQDDSWFRPTRPAIVTPHAVGPGGVGTFEFTLKAPSSPGTYREFFNLVAEGYRWFNDLRLSYTINVVEPSAPSDTDRTLAAGEQLTKGKYLLSQDKQSVFILQPDGNLVLYRNFIPVWSTGPKAGAQRLIMQGDGNLVLYSGSGVPLWHSQTAYGNNGSSLNLQTDGNLVLYNSGGDPLWTTSTVHKPNLLAYVNTSLSNGGTLHPGQDLQTANRKYRLVLQGDGNLVLYRSNGNPLWWAGTNNGKRLRMQSDGNLVLYNEKGKAVWNSKTPTRGRSNLTMQSDGNLVLYDSRGRATWHSGTRGAQ